MARDVVCSRNNGVDCRWLMRAAWMAPGVTGHRVGDATATGCSIRSRDGGDLAIGPNSARPSTWPAPRRPSGGSSVRRRASPACSRPRERRRRPATYSRRSTAGSLRASIRRTSRTRGRCWTSSRSFVRLTSDTEVSGPARALPLSLD